VSAVPVPAARRRQLLPPTLAATARSHWLIIALLAGGLALRVMAQLAYRPVLLFIDSYVYLANLHHLDPTGDYPIGYDLFLRPILWLGNLAVVAGIQHLLGLGMGLTIYLLLQRRGVRPWLSALAAAPVLLDAYQVQIEQNLMADTLFEALLVATVAVLTWRRRPGYGAAVGAGGLLGAAVLVRLVGEPLVVLCALFVVIAGSGRWRRAGLALALIGAFAVPVGAYAGYYHSRTGKLGISAVSGGALYGRVVSFAECDGLKVPSYERILCPTWPRGKRPDADYLVHAPNAPRFKLQPPPGMSNAEVERDFARRIIAHQPLDLLAAVGRDFAKGFAPARVTFAGDVSVDRWKFPLDYPVWLPGYTLREATAATHRFGGGGPAVHRPLADLLRDYQKFGYVPGPVIAVALLLGLAAGLGLGRTRDLQQRLACLLYTTVGTGTLLTAAMFEFSWRYQLPGLVLLPLGGALGATILLPPRGRPAPVPAFPDDADRRALGEFHERYGAPLRFAPVVVVIAAYNEAQGIGAVVESIPRRSRGLEVDTLVVVDGATDGTAEVARRHGARVCELPLNRGQGAALRLGYHIAREGRARYVVTTDADGQYDIGELPLLLEPLISGEADFVTGSRALGSNQGADPVRRLGSRVFAWLVTVLTGRRVTDTSFGFRAMRASVTGAVTLSQRQYQSAELLIGVLARGFRVVEQPMTMRPRTGGKSKKGGNLVYGWRYAKVVVGTWLRERGAAPGMAGGSGVGGVGGVSGAPRAPGPGQPPVSAADR
jgi:hypothetical protein